MNTFGFGERLSMSFGRASADVESTLLAEVPGAIKVRKAAVNDDRHGTDYWIDHKRGTPLSVDTKVRDIDPVDKYGEDDLALETWSVIREKVGWTLDETKRTDFILWWFIPTSRWVLVPFLPLQGAFRKRRGLWTSKYRVEPQKTRDRGREWISECVFVPREVIWNAIIEDHGGSPNHAIRKHVRRESSPRNILEESSSLEDFAQSLRRVHRKQGRPVNQKLTDSNLRDTCSDCGATAKTQLPFIAFTVEDFLGNERVICGKCWREEQR